MCSSAGDKATKVGVFRFLRAFTQDFERHGAAVIEKVREERPQDYLRVAASLLPKQMDIGTNQSRPVPELTDAELNEEIARIKEIRDNGIEATIEKILVARGHAAPTPAEREQIRLQMAP
jgi:hypothetical protein